MTEQLTLLKVRVKSLEDQLILLQEHHQTTQEELAESKKRYSDMEKLYNSLLEAVNNNDASPLPEVRLTIDGDFSSKRIFELERELEEYRSGVNASVDRRVKEIVKEYTKLDEEGEGQQLLSTPPSHNHHYNITLKSAHSEPSHQDGLVEELEEVKADNQILSQQLHKCQQLIDTLQQQNDLLASEARSQTDSARGSQIGRSSYKQSQMRQITNLVSAISNRKTQQQQRSLRMSKQWPIKSSASLFSIKNGINRPKQQSLI